MTCTVSILSVFTCTQWHCGLNLVATHLEGPETLSVKDHKIAIKVHTPHYCVALACSHTPPMIPNHTIELNMEALSTGTLLPVTGTHHAHAEKTGSRIGESFPDGGYGEY